MKGLLLSKFKALLESVTGAEDDKKKSKQALEFITILLTNYHLDMADKSAGQGSLGQA